MDINTWLSELIAALPVLDERDQHEADDRGEPIEAVFPLRVESDGESTFRPWPEHGHRAVNRILSIDLGSAG